MKIKLKHLGNRNYESAVKYVELSNWFISYVFSRSLLLFKCQQNKSKQLASEKDKNLVLEKKNQSSILIRCKKTSELVT